MKKTILTILMIFAFAPQVLCQEAGKIVSTQGRVDIFRADSRTAMLANAGDLLNVGDSIRTKSGSKAQVLFRDKSVLRLAQNSKVLVKDYRLDDKERRISAVIELSRGKARAIIAKTPSGASFVIKTPNTEGTVKGSDVTAFYQAGSSGMFVSEGKLYVINLANPKNRILVPKGSACLITMDELPKGPRPYSDAEKKLNDEDTYVPVSISRMGKVSIIKGAVAKVSGMVTITPKDSAGAHKAGINDILGEGDSIETGEDGYIEVLLDNNNAINLKPNTKLKIIKLAISPQTGEFENIFEVTLGKIKARIENLKGNSKFEVKTPQAICGARGTIMYIHVLHSLTKSFFEGGKGYIENILSGRSQNVGAGQNASADDGGGVSDPAYTSEEERQSYGEGWDPGNGTEGYSSPDGGGPGHGFFNAGGPNNNGLTNFSGRENNFGVYIPFSENKNTVQEIIPDDTSPGDDEGSVDFDSARVVTFPLLGGWIMYDAKGTYSGNAIEEPGWTMALSGVAKGFLSTKKFYWTGIVSGNSSEPGSGMMTGELNGFWLSQGNKAGTLKAGLMSGDMLGSYTDIGEDAGEGAWNAVGAGKWREINNNLNVANMESLDASIRSLPGISIPITCAYNLQLAGGVGITQAAMAINLYALSQTAQNGVWAAIINGTYSTKPTTIAVADGSDNVILSIATWKSSQWAADVSGTVGGNAITGQASGNYKSQEIGGTFSGAGAGTWSQPSPIED